MVDTLTPAQRSAVMARIRGKDTAPELAVRSLLRRMGYRFRVHRRDLPGSPDIVLSGRGVVVFVHGCFWHRHRGCRHAATPASRARFWRLKFERNVERDARNRVALRRLGWRVITVWECEISGSDQPSALAARLKRLIDDQPTSRSRTPSGTAPNRCRAAARLPHRSASGA
jgi:DNA mismatch endonuclease (patch repair protein)